MLAASEARLRGILDSAMDAIITVDEAQRVVLFNRPRRRCSAAAADEAIGAPLERFIPERFRGGARRRTCGGFGDRRDLAAAWATRAS